MNSEGAIIQEACPIYLDFSIEGSNFLGLASYDNHIQTCELRLDLDADNSGYRFGPHFWQELRYTRSYPIADDDVGLRSLVGALDSVTVKLRTAGSQAGDDLLSYPATDRLLVRNYGDTLLHLVDQPASSITLKSRYCGSWLRYENPHAAKAALRFSRLARNHNSFDLMQRNLRFGPLVATTQTTDQDFIDYLP
jgi:phage baseplate assembly protein W